ncbi:MAG: hypothetical protein NTY73_04085 [Candidatus Micrarchaeota archaeon]|nr:hypothetical protein [Candidatus Micrarchaeota archaeon]
MKRNDVQKLKILLFILACLVPVLVYAAMFGTNNFNWLSIPNPHELYLESYDTSASQYVNFAVHSSTDSDCTMDYCWAVRNVSLKSGLNVFREPLDNCSGSFRVTLDCGQSIVSFRCNKTSEGRSSYNASLAATANTVKTGRAYPISLLAVLLLSIALVSLVINPSMGSSLSLLILFTLSSSLLVMQFHLTSLGLNEWIIPLACAVAWVSIWKKMQ